VDDVDGFADQLDRSLTDVLDELAPLLTQTKRCGRRSNRWLSSSAVRAKRTRRRMERQWRRTGLDEDRAIYWRACHMANAEITKARESFHRQRLESTTGNPRAQSRVVRELLHSNESDAVLEPADARKICDSFSNFFHGKLRRIADEIQIRLQTAPGLTRVFSVGTSPDPSMNCLRSPLMTFFVSLSRFHQNRRHSTVFRCHCLRNAPM
jgi:hypothetical protein